MILVLGTIVSIKLSPKERRMCFELSLVKLVHMSKIAVPPTSYPPGCPLESPGRL